jgi:hypothetical protein
VYVVMCKSLDQLTVEKNQVHSKEVNAEESDIDLDQYKSNSNIDDTLKMIVKSSVPEATLLNNTGAEIRYQLPIAACGNFPAMFDGLDAEVNKGSIQSYGMSMTTLVSLCDFSTRVSRWKMVLAVFLSSQVY